MKSSLNLVALSLGVLGIASAAYRPLAREARVQSARPAEVNFDRDIKPIISQHCFKCHGPDAASAAAGVRLDSFTHATAKLADGQWAIVPGDPAKSRMIQKVSAKDPAMRMPPEGVGISPLTPAEIELLERWIAEGAKYEKHWSLVPPSMPALPLVSDSKWCRNELDRFVLAKLDSAGLKPEPEASRDTLALRASQTLTGLPPTSDELAKFRNDKRADAYERFVDRLLAKPEYGEHQARYWLDAVRYGDTHGLQLDNERGIYPYRDWVIRAFNQDLPYDTFAKWQLAGDLLPKPTNEQLIATGYVRMNLTSNEGGAIPEEFLARNTFDRVDTTGTVFLGMTIGCAKCHDHKFDPIKQSDYYGLYAFFDSTKDEPLDGNITYPGPVIRATTPNEQRHLAALDLRDEQLLNSVDMEAAKTWMEARHVDYPTTRDWQISPVTSYANFDEAFDKAAPGEPGQPQPAWKPFDFQIGRDAANIIKKDNSTVYVRGTLTSATKTTLTLRVASDDAVKVWLNGKLIHSHKIARGLDQGEDLVSAEVQPGDNELIAKVINGASLDGLRIRMGDALSDRIDVALKALRANASDPAAHRAIQQIYLDSGPAGARSLEYRDLVKRRSEFEESIPQTLIAREMDKPRPTFILKRGQYDQRGAAVERHIPAALGSLPAGAPEDRLGFADWLTARDNPLFARVFVNRVWQQHFGVGIVKTSEDFGSQGEWPVNEPLLNYLATRFVKDGYSVKKLNRLIVTSAAFRQRSKISAKKLAEDPENRLISRGPRFRLDAEVIRDKALACGGLLVERIGGHGFKPYQPSGIWENTSDPASATHFYVRDRDWQINRRSLYMFWKRTSPPPAMVTFDAPLRDTCIVRRSITDTPLQALTTLNETAFLECSRVMAQRLLRAPGNDEQRLSEAFEIALSRPPKPVEIEVLMKALKRYREEYTSNAVGAVSMLKVGDAPQDTKDSAPEQAAWMVVCSTIMNTDEFLTQH